MGAPCGRQVQRLYRLSSGSNLGLGQPWASGRLNRHLECDYTRQGEREARDAPRPHGT